MGNAERVPPRILFDAPYLSYLFDLVAGPQNWRLIAAAPAERGIVCGIADAGSPDPDDPGLVAWAGRYAASMRGRGGDRVGLSTSASLEWLRPASGAGEGRGTRRRSPPRPTGG